MRSIRALDRQGWKWDKTEHWNPFAHKRKDLFGFIDMLAVRGGVTLAVQTTTADNLAARVTKIQESPFLEPLLAAGWVIVVHGWRKAFKENNRWVCNVVRIYGKEKSSGIAGWGMAGDRRQHPHLSAEIEGT